MIFSSLMGVLLAWYSQTYLDWSFFGETCELQTAKRKNRLPRSDSKISERTVFSGRGCYKFEEARLDILPGDGTVI